MDQRLQCPHCRSALQERWILRCLVACCPHTGEYGSALCSEGSCDRPFLLQRRAGVAAERALPPSLMLLQEEFKKAASYSGAQGQLAHFGALRTVHRRCARVRRTQLGSECESVCADAPRRFQRSSHIASTSRDPNLSRAHSGISGSTVFSSFSFLPDKPNGILCLCACRML